jgi:hypothetical protein
LERGDGVVAGTALEAGDAKVKPGGVVFRGEAHGGAKCGDGLGETAEAFQDVACLMMRLGERAIEGLGARERGEGLGCSTETAEREAVVELVGRRGGARGDGAGEECFGAGDGSLLEVQLAKAMEGVGVRGLGLQNLFVEQSRFRQPAGAMVRQSLREKFCGRRHGDDRNGEKR